MIKFSLYNEHSKKYSDRGKYIDDYSVFSIFIMLFISFLICTIILNGSNPILIN